MRAAEAAHPPRPARVPEADSDGGAFAKDSVAVAAWTAVSRASGFLRIAVVAAVLGPTYLGNVFQATNNIPNLTYVALTGALFSNLLIPSLVRHIDAGDAKATERVAGAFLSTALLGFGAVAAVVVLAGPVVLRLLTAGVADPSAAASQRHVGVVLLAMFMPQLLLYAVVGTAEAVMNAHGRFALASAAPAMENIGIIATMTATAVFFGTGQALASPGTGLLCLLGFGTTGAVALHAAVQWWGARRVGVRLLPRRTWREPEIKAIVRRAVPSLGYSVLAVVQPLGAMVVANRIPGGVLAFDFALNFYALASAIGARPVAVSLLPRLSRLFHAGDRQRFRDELVRGAALVAFLTVPAAVAFAVLAQPIARAVTFGQMATARGQTLIAPSLASLSPAVIGSAVMVLATYACYARHDASAPLRAVGVQVVVAAAGMTVAFAVPAGATALLILGLTISLADLAGGWRLAVRLRRELPVRGVSLLRPLLRTGAAALLMAGPAYVVADRLPALLATRWNHQIAMLAAAVVGAAVFIGAQRLWRAPELALLRAAVRVRPRGAAATETGDPGGADAGDPGGAGTGDPGGTATGDPGGAGAGDAGGAAANRAVERSAP
ncbi:MAG: putative peptidoglycan lipid flippase [Micromonosporaceae bacterium]|nr:putative peptidoglycan lipid flippase [Micromonosporaceae bacterium]